MALEKVLVAFDGSESSKKALTLAADIVRTDADIRLDVANVVAIPRLSDEQYISFASVLEMMEEDAEKLLDEALEALESDEEFENEVQTLLMKGVDPASEIAKLTEMEGYDIIVIGSRGLAGLKEYMGSVSHKLLNISKTPVLVVK